MLVASISSPHPPPSASPSASPLASSIFICACSPPNYHHHQQHKRTLTQPLSSTPAHPGLPSTPPCSSHPPAASSPLRSPPPLPPLNTTAAIALHLLTHALILSLPHRDRDEDSPGSCGVLNVTPHSTDSGAGSHDASASGTSCSSSPLAPHPLRAPPSLSTAIAWVYLLAQQVSPPASELPPHVHAL